MTNINVILCILWGTLSGIWIYSSLAIIKGIERQRCKHLREDEREIFYNLLNKCEIMTVLWEKNLDFVYMNLYMKEQLGYDRDIEDKKVFEEIFSIKDASDLARIKQKLFWEQDRQQEVRGKNGGKRTILWHSATINLGNRKETTLLTMGIDISEKVKFDEQQARYTTILEESLSTIKFLEERQELAMEAANIIMLYKMIDIDEIFIPNAAKQLLDIQKDVVLKQEFYKKIYPEDLLIYLDYVSQIQMLNNPSGRCEIRLKLKDGKYYWYLVRYKLLYDAKGMPKVIAGAFININEEKKKDRLIAKLAFRDEVTGLYNKPKFLLVIRTNLKKAIKEAEFCMMTIDIYKYSLITRIYGRKMNDLALKKLGILIRRQLPEGGVCCRVKEGEFLLSFEIKDKEEIKEIYDKITKNIQQMKVSPKFNYTIEILGTAIIYTKEDSDLDKVYDNIHFIMEEMKDKDRKGLQIFDKQCYTNMLVHQLLAMELGNTIQKNQLRLYYQPKVDSNKGKIVGAEALIRWEHPQYGLILPGEFIPLAEETGFITEIDKWVLRQACGQVKTWQQEYHKNIHVSINLSAIEFYQSNIVEMIKEVIEEIRVEPQLLQIELTESMVLMDITQTIMKMKAIQALGVKMELDDFGTGYSSLSYLRSLPINVLKLDRSFITHIEDEEINRNITKTIITLAKLLKLEVIAEGVEKKEQVDLLREMGCSIIQGYYYAEPLSQMDFERNYLIERS